MTLDRLDRAVEMRTGLRMRRDDIGAGLHEGFKIGVHRRDHQMHVEGLFRVRPQRLHHGRTDGEIGHVMPVHHIDMNPVGARLVDGANLLAELGEIG